MAVEKGITENIEEETKVEEIKEQPEGLPPEVTIEGEETVEETVSDDFDGNLAEDMDERTLKRLGMELISEYKKDKDFVAPNGELAAPEKDYALDFLIS